uniref:Uncharacterized protein n=3 Tax=Candidatus Kentrum eta TaxID=2126337 RepID=A0A450VBA1_9GAMM|nr:MAG: hypothetical protein BECKH772B_GA0070898_100831 [Candidatus Kentron sp. H]VFK02059.1 MAG: hypothetical protein BECKH772C_GA0070978_1008012 [Candidatus Kentron sp. H]
MAPPLKPVPYLSESYLPLEMTRSDLRDQELRRQLSSKSLDSVRMAKPFATQLLCESAEFGQVIQLSMDRTDIGNRFAVLTIAPRIGERALPLIRTAESGAANIAYALKAIFSLTLAKEICSLPVPSHRVIKNATRPMCHYSKARL